MMNQRASAIASILLLIAAVLVLIGVGVGSTGFESVVHAVDDPVAMQILWDIRLPRTLGAWVAGALLGLAGAVAQGLFRNPLADPYLLGSASGASLGVALSLVLFGVSPFATHWLMRLGLTAGAFAGAVGGVLLTLLLAQGGEFAFVVFQAAVGAQVLPAQTASLLIGAVAVSMLVSPLIMVAIDKLLLPRYANCGALPMEEISEPQEAPLLIAGFGRYGQIVARVLLAQGQPCTVLDHDAEMIEAARKFGYRVFYGDATRLDLLRTAGASQAQVLVVAVDDVAQSLEIVALAREHFPELTIVARARDVTHWNRLRDQGVMLVQRELFESSLLSARQAPSKQLSEHIIYPSY